MSRRQTRSEARERAFSLIFQLATKDIEPEFLIEHMLEEYPESVTNLAYIKETVYGVQQNRASLAEKIAAVLPENRGVERLSKAVYTILLLAVYEIESVSDVPEKVAVNEAVELAKKYAEEDAAPFVNGVLSGILKR